MKIAIILGTRPEIIKMSPVIDEIEKRNIPYVLIHTGQHYDHEMSDQFFQDLELKKPNFNIGVGSGSHGEQTAAMIKGIEKVLIDEKPDFVMVEGDTNAVLSGALVSSKLHIPLGHVEAGLRSYDKTMPEEINRYVADICSKIYFVPTENSAINLLFEGINPHHIYITGNTVVDACLRNLKIAEKKSELSSILNIDRNILTVTIHRAENVDSNKRLKNIVDALLELDDYEIVFPVHPRTVKNLNKFNLYNKLQKASHIKLFKPMGYLDFLVLLSYSKLVMTDSGGIQEESITLNVPCLTLRYNTERPETVETGGNILVGAEKNRIVETFKRIINDQKIYNRMTNALNPYGDGHASQRIIDTTIKMYGEGKLNDRIPEKIINNLERHLININDDITVSEFELNNKNLIVRIVFENEIARFPYPDLNLNKKVILTESFNNL
jgi:UDP-N-acetylglucosamine 2-epimerase (non-hydrolysing)